MKITIDKDISFEDLDKAIKNMEYQKAKRSYIKKHKHRLLGEGRFKYAELDPGSKFPWVVMDTKLGNDEIAAFQIDGMAKRFCEIENELYPKSDNWN